MTPKDSEGRPLDHRARHAGFAEMPERAALACLCCAIVVLAFVALFPGCRHWFVFPVFLCGVIVVADALEWISGRTDVFDPVGLIGLLGVHFFFLTPLLQASQGFWIEQWTLVQTPPPDWRPWFGFLAALTAPGLLVYRVVVHRIGSDPAGSVGPELRRIDRFLLLRILLVGMLVSLVLQVTVYREFGGFAGYIHNFVDLQGGRESGLGRIFVVVESFPLLAAMAFAVWGAGRPRCRSIPVLGLFFGCTVAACMFFGGLRGSRSATIWVLFLAAGLVHFLIRRMTRKMVALGIVLLGFFMYGYGFYKWGGAEGLASITDRRSRAEWSARTNKTLLRTLVFDLSRSNSQAYLLYRLSITDDYSYGYGRTYLGALALVVPKSVWPDRPRSKDLEGSQLQFGVGSKIRSRWAYGLTGEALLNFGLAGVPLLFLPLGLLAGWTRRLGNTLQKEDYRWLLQPFLIALCFQVLAFDASNVLVFSVKYGLVMALPIWLSRLIGARIPGAVVARARDRGTER